MRARWQDDFKVTEVLPFKSKGKKAKSRAGRSGDAGASGPDATARIHRVYDSDETAVIKGGTGRHTHGTILMDRGANGSGGAAGGQGATGVHCAEGAHGAAGARGAASAGAPDGRNYDADYDYGADYDDGYDAGYQAGYDAGYANYDADYDVGYDDASYDAADYGNDYDDAASAGTTYDGPVPAGANQPIQEDPQYYIDDDGTRVPLLLGRYAITGQAGSGSFASVVVAWDTRIERRVAIKCLPLEDAGASSHVMQNGSLLLDNVDTSSVAGLDEARTAAKLSDSCIVQVYDFEVKDGMAYLILEYVDGITLADLLAYYPDQMNADVVASVFKSVAHALEVAHRKHVLHLDIKPENVLIDQQGQVKVTDFGLARLATESGYGTAAGGTIGYMPPEQMNGQELDERCDQWALASLTYEMISGENPFLADTLDEAKDAIYGAELVIPSLCMEGLDEDIDDIMFCALDPDPQERYDSVKDFATQLQPCLGSTRKGKNALKRLVAQELAPEQDDADWEDADGFDVDDFESGEIPAVSENDLDMERGSAGLPWETWHLSSRMRQVLMRLWNVVDCGIIAFIMVNSFFGHDAWGSQPVAWGVLAACLVLAAVLPSIGALVVCEAWGVALCALGAPLPGIVLMVAAGAWWYFCARLSVESTNVGMTGVVCGSIGMAPLVPLIAGYLLSARDALISTLFAACLAVLLAGLGSASLLGWNALSFMALPFDGDFTGLLLQVVSQPSCWIMILGWVVAAVACSVLCGMGKKVWCVCGMVLGGACLVGALVGGSLLNTFGAVALQNPYDLAPVLGACALGIALVCVAPPARGMRA